MNHVDGDAPLRPRLDDIARSMAVAIQPLFSAPSLARYCGYLGAMYHYTREAGDELRHAASLATEAELARLFDHLAKEEQSHYRLAELDLRELGAVVDPHASPAVQAYRDFWRSADTSGWARLGALYAFENVAGFAHDEGVGTLTSLGLAPRQMRFALAHVEADAGHGREVGACVDRFAAEHGDEILEGARRGADLWVALHLAIIEAEAAAEGAGP